MEGRDKGGREGEGGGRVTTRKCSEGYNLGMSSLMLAILKNQLRQVSLAESGT